MFGLSPKDLKRQLRRMGIKLDVEELENVQRATIELPEKRLVIENPQVVLMKMHGQSMFYITGEAREELLYEEREVEIREEDIQLVASQAGVSLEEARKALEASQGDLAQAIMLLETKKKMNA